MLVFFKSYADLQRSEARWNQNIGLFKKKIFYERSSTAETNKAIEEYKKRTETNREGAIFCCVMGAKCAEGIDFKDCYGRLALVTGKPFVVIKVYQSLSIKGFLTRTRLVHVYKRKKGS